MASDKASQQTKARKSRQAANGPAPDGKGKDARELPDRETALGILHKMQLIRRFEERARRCT